MNMREIQKVQQRLMKMQEELEATQFTGTAGGGAVTISSRSFSAAPLAV